MTNNKEYKTSFQFKGFHINESFIKQEPNREVSKEIKFGFNPKGIIDSNNKIFKLNLGIKVENKAKTFLARIETTGTFLFDSEIDEKLLDSLFYVNAPALLFPYIRAYISTLTTLSGIEAITLPTVNLTSLGKVLRDNTETI